jgi:hypothetical protein
MGRYSASEQVRRGLRVGSLIVVITAAILVVLYLATRVAGISFTDLSRDAAATLDGPWYTGALSNTAVAVLLVGAGIAIFAAGLLPSLESKSRKGLLVGLALVVMVVAADDLFMLHEAVFPLIGIGSVMSFALYGVALIAVLWIWRRVIVESTDWIFLALAALAMGFSVAIDVVLEERLFTLPVSGELIEDPAKILGMVFMSYYLVATSRQALLDLMGSDSV